VCGEEPLGLADGGAGHVEPGGYVAVGGNGTPAWRAAQFPGQAGGDLRGKGAGAGPFGDGGGG
jgi:hypothetical protein